MKGAIDRFVAPRHQLRATDADEARQLALWRTAQERMVAAGCGIPLFDLRQVWVRRTNLDLGYRSEGSLNLAPPVTEATRLR